MLPEIELYLRELRDKQTRGSEGAMSKGRNNGERCKRWDEMRCRGKRGRAQDYASQEKQLSLSGMDWCSSSNAARRLSWHGMEDA